MSDLVSAWRTSRIEMRIPGMAGFAQAPSLGNKVRGALGEVLLQSASKAVRERQPCDWPVTSTAEYFFGRRPLVRVGDHDSELARPFVLAFTGEPDGSLGIGMNVFGLACERTASVSDALIHALRRKVKWSDMKKDGNHFLPTKIEPIVTKCRHPGLPVCNRENETRIRMTFLTQIDGERGDLETAPHLIFHRLVRRVTLLAPWHGVDLSPSYDQLLHEAASAVVLECAPTSKVQQPRGGHRFANRLSPALDLVVDQVGPDLAQLLQLGQLVHVGRGASLGLGRYRLETF